jgi:acylphosphatase
LILLRQLGSFSSNPIAVGQPKFCFVPMTMIRIHVLITGQVQGVGYRLATAQQATQLGLSGWVQNLPDGRVEAVFEGDRPSVEQMVQWCHQGPPTATVEAVSAIEEPPQGLTEFRLRRRG